MLAESSTTSQVQAGSEASFNIFVWSTGAASTNVSVTASVAAAPALGSPKFIACPAAAGSGCTIASLPVGRADELVATIPVQSTAAAGELVELTAEASATGSLSYGSTATDVVGAASGTVNLPLSSVLPPISGTGTNAVNPSTLFPTVGASGGASIDGPAAGSPVLQASTDASAAPLGGQLVNVELLGLIVLFGAVIVAVVRVALRTPRPAQPATNSAVDELAAPKAAAKRQRWRHWVRTPRVRMARMHLSRTKARSRADEGA